MLNETQPRSFLLLVIGLSFSILAILSQHCSATTVTITFKGVIQSGTDPSGADVSGQSFTLTLAFDDTRGRFYSVPNFSEMASSDTIFIGTGLLQIGEYGQNYPFSGNNSSVIGRNVVGKYYVLSIKMGQITAFVTVPIVGISDADWRASFPDVVPLKDPRTAPHYSSFLGIILGTSMQFDVTSVREDGIPPSASRCSKVVYELNHLEQSTGDPINGFIRNQACIAGRACAIESGLTDPTWLEKLVPDFVNPFLAQAGKWKTIIDRCRTRPSWLPFRDELCQDDMARYHISQDLQGALDKDGCGSAADWSVVGNIIASCINENLDQYWPGFRQLASWIADTLVQEERDGVRTRCIDYRTSNNLNPVL